MRGRGNPSQRSGRGRVSERVTTRAQRRPSPPRAIRPCAGRCSSSRRCHPGARPCAGRNRSPDHYPSASAVRTERAGRGHPPLPANAASEPLACNERNPAPWRLDFVRGGPPGHVAAAGASAKARNLNFALPHTPPCATCANVFQALLHGGATPPGSAHSL